MTVASSIDRYPLTWPNGWKRTAAHQRRPAAFSKRETYDHFQRERGLS